MPYSERTIARVRRQKARQLVERLVAEERVTISEPDEDEVTEWRRVVDYAKRHGLTPAGKRIEKMRMWNRDLQTSWLQNSIPIREGIHPRTRRQFRSPHSFAPRIRSSQR